MHSSNRGPRRGGRDLRWIACACVAVTVLARPMAQTPAPRSTFRGGVDVVLLDVSVLNKSRQPVHDLRAADFVVREDGQLRQVVGVDEVRLPAPQPLRTAAWTREAPLDVTDNRPTDGRFVVIMFDHTIKGPRAAQVARDVANAAIDRLQPGDRAAVVFTQPGGRPTDFTADKLALRRAAASPVIGTSLAGNSFEDTQCFCGLCSIEIITQVAHVLAGQPLRPKTLLFIGSAIAVDVQPPSGPSATDCSPSTKLATREMLEAAQDANLVVHAIDPEGLTIRAGLTAAARGAGSGPVSPTPPTTSIASHPSLQILAEQTGGRAVFHDNQPAAVVGDLFDEGAAYYLVAFRAADDGRVADAAHAIDVRVQRNGLEVRARRAYFAPAAAVTLAAPVAPSTLTDVVNQPLPLSALPLRAAFATVDRGAQAGETRMAAVLGVSIDRASATRLEVLTTVIDLQGRQIGSRTQTVDIPASTAAAAMAAGGFDVRSSLDLRPGRYQVRTAVLDQGSQKIGSVFANVDVPDTSAAVVSLSDLMFEAAPGLPSVAVDPVAPPLQAMTSLRTFVPTDRVRVFARVFRKSPAAGARDVIVHMRVVDDQNRRVYEQATPLEAQVFQPDGMAVFAANLPMGTLRPGDYLMSVEIAGSGAAAARQARMAVR